MGRAAHLVFSRKELFELELIIVSIAGDEGLVTLSRTSADIQAAVAARDASNERPDARFTARMTRTFLRLVLERNEQLAGLLAGELHSLEGRRIPDKTPDFIEHAFRLKKEISSTSSDLWRFKGIIRSLVESPDSHRSLEGGVEEEVRTIANDADYLFETVENLRDELGSLIDLHLNVVSFEMNKVMRVLAVVSVLGLLPASVGGLLGMNVMNNPRPVTLPQVIFGVSVGMLLCLYVFLMKGWLR